MVRNFGYDAGGWRVDRHPRFLADTSGDGRADIVGFGTPASGSRARSPTAVSRHRNSSSNNFGYDAGGWRVEQHPRFLADTTGDGRADIVGFGNAGVYVSRAQADGTFERAATRGQQLRLRRRRLAGRPSIRGSWPTPPATAAPTSSASATPASTSRAPRPTAASTPVSRVVDNFGYDAGGWRVDQHPRFLADTTGDGRADIVGFGNAGVYVSRAQADGTFGAPATGGRQLRLRRRRLARRAASAVPGRHYRRRPRRHRRLRQRRGLRVARPGRRHLQRAAAGGRTTSATTPAAGASTGIRGSWPTPPATAAPTSSASANAGVYVSRALAGGGFDAPGLVVTNFGYDAGGWRVDRHPRFLADTTGDRRADIIGFGNAGVWLHRS